MAELATIRDNDRMADEDVLVWEPDKHAPDGFCDTWDEQLAAMPIEHLRVLLRRACDRLDDSVTGEVTYFGPKHKLADKIVAELLGRYGEDVAVYRERSDSSDWCYE